MKKQVKKLVACSLCAAMAVTIVPQVDMMTGVQQVYAADGGSETVALSDLVIKFLAVPEYEPNRYTKSNGGKWAPEELEKGLHIKADMLLGEGNPEGMMAPLKNSLADITAYLEADQATGNIKITYNGLVLTMKAGSTTATLDNGKEKKTLTIAEGLAPYFKLVEGEKTDKGEPYYACYLPVIFTAETLGGNVMWNDAMHRLEMAFAFYYTDAAVSPNINSKSAYTTVGMEDGGYSYDTFVKRVDKTKDDKLTDEAIAANVANLIKASMNVVDPVYQNADGGWAKTNTAYDLLDDTFTRLYNTGYSTVDNGSTYGHVKFLSRVIKLSKAYPELFTAYSNELKAIEAGFWKGVAYFIEAQTDQGGWQQYYPYGVGYFANITYNDSAMTNIMYVIYSLTHDTALRDQTLCDDLAWAREAIANGKAGDASVTAEALNKSWDAALDFTLKAQVKIDGTLTGWAQQYEPDAETPTPVGGRAYELPSVSPDESEGVLKMLANIVNPSDGVKAAIKGYTDWVQTLVMPGYKYTTINDRTRELGKDKLLLYTGNVKDRAFGRFYGLDTTGAYYGLDASGKLTNADCKFYAIFSGRDGVAQLSCNNGMSERRSGYSMIRTGKDTNATKIYEEWLKSTGQSN